MCVLVFDHYLVELGEGGACGNGHLLAQLGDLEGIVFTLLLHLVAHGVDLGFLVAELLVFRIK